MTTLLPKYLEELDHVKKALNKTKSLQLRSQPLKSSLRQLIEKYFKEIRPTFMTASKVDGDVEIIDGDMQALLILCHKQGSLKVYKMLLSRIRKALVLLDARILTSPIVASDSDFSEDERDGLIVSTLEKILPSAALSYRQALIDLKTESRCSWRGPATDLRESMRETLDHLAPDHEVIKMSGYKQIPDVKGPTMKQKVRYILKKRGSSKANSTTVENATDIIENAVGSFVRSVYTRSSVSTHTPTDKKEVIRVRDYVRVVLCELLEV